MRRYANRVDNNQDAIVQAFEAEGCIVDRTNRDWDLTVQYKGYASFLVEVKNPDTAYGKKGLNKRQQGLKVARWTVYTPRDAIQCANALKVYDKALKAL